MKVDLVVNGSQVGPAEFNRLAAELLEQISALVSDASPHLGYVLVLQSGTAQMIGAHIPPSVAAAVLIQAAGNLSKDLTDEDRADFLARLQFAGTRH